jgi:ATP-dependent DNA ligase
MTAPGRTSPILDVRTAASEWRPQQISEISSGGVLDPIIEPLWTGLRVLAVIDGDTVELRDLDGDVVEEFEPVETALAEAGRAGRLLIDGYLTHQVLQPIGNIAKREIAERQQNAPTMGQLWFGSFARRRSRQPKQPVAELGRDPVPPDDEVAFVAVDLLWLDDESVLDVPLLERKRILESVLGESRLVRRGTYVHPPVDPWISSWRAFGFSRMVYKGANSRYVPGETSPHWAVADLPSR